MKIMLVNNNGGGFAGEIEVDDNLTIEQLFQARMPAAKPADYLIRVNRLPVTANQVLRADDRVSITPTKIQGAR